MKKFHILFLLLLISCLNLAAQQITVSSASFPSLTMCGSSQSGTLGVSVTGSYTNLSGYSFSVTMPAGVYVTNVTVPSGMTSSITNATSTNPAGFTVVINSINGSSQITYSLQAGCSVNLSATGVTFSTANTLGIVLPSNSNLTITNTSVGNLSDVTGTQNNGLTAHSGQTKTRTYTLKAGGGTFNGTVVFSETIPTGSVIQLQSVTTSPVYAVSQPVTTTSSGSTTYSYTITVPSLANLQQLTINETVQITNCLINNNGNGFNNGQTSATIQWGCSTNDYATNFSSYPALIISNDGTANPNFSTVSNTVGNNFMCFPDLNGAQNQSITYLAGAGASPTNVYLMFDNGTPGPVYVPWSQGQNIQVTVYHGYNSSNPSGSTSVSKYYVYQDASDLAPNVDFNGYPITGGPTVQAQDYYNWYNGTGNFIYYYNYINTMPVLSNGNSGFPNCYNTTSGTNGTDNVYRLKIDHLQPVAGGNVVPFFSISINPGDAIQVSWTQYTCSYSPSDVGGKSFAQPGVQVAFSGGCNGTASYGQGLSEVGALVDEEILYYSELLNGNPDKCLGTNDGQITPVNVQITSFRDDPFANYFGSTPMSSTTDLGTLQLVLNFDPGLYLDLSINNTALSQGYDGKTCGTSCEPCTTGTGEANNAATWGHNSSYETNSPTGINESASSPYNIQFVNKDTKFTWSPTGTITSFVPTSNPSGHAINRAYTVNFSMAQLLQLIQQNSAFEALSPYCGQGYLNACIQQAIANLTLNFYVRSACPSVPNDYTYVNYTFSYIPPASAGCSTTANFPIIGAEAVKFLVVCPGCTVPGANTTVTDMYRAPQSLGLLDVTGASGAVEDEAPDGTATITDIVAKHNVTNGDILVNNVQVVLSDGAAYPNGFTISEAAAAGVTLDNLYLDIEVPMLASNSNIWGGGPAVPALNIYDPNSTYDFSVSPDGVTWNKISGSIVQTQTIGSNVHVTVQIKPSDVITGASSFTSGQTVYMQNYFQVNNALLGNYQSLNVNYVAYFSDCDNCNVTNLSTFTGGDALRSLSSNPPPISCTMVNNVPTACTVQPNMYYLCASGLSNLNFTPFISTQTVQLTNYDGNSNFCNKVAQFNASGYFLNAQDNFVYNAFPNEYRQFFNGGTGSTPPYFLAQIPAGFTISDIQYIVQLAPNMTPGDSWATVEYAQTLDINAKNTAAFASIISSWGTQDTKNNSMIKIPFAFTDMTESFISNLGPSKYYTMPNPYTGTYSTSSPAPAPVFYMPDDGYSIYINVIFSPLSNCSNQYSNPTGYANYGGATIEYYNYVQMDTVKLFNFPEMPDKSSAGTIGLSGFNATGDLLPLATNLSATVQSNSPLSLNLTQTQTTGTQASTAFTYNIQLQNQCFLNPTNPNQCQLDQLGNPIPSQSFPYLFLYLHPLDPAVQITGVYAGTFSSVPSSGALTFTSQPYIPSGSTTTDGTFEYIIQLGDLPGGSWQVNLLPFTIAGSYTYSNQSGCNPVYACGTTAPACITQKNESIAMQYGWNCSGYPQFTDIDGGANSKICNIKSLYSSFLPDGITGVDFALNIQPIAAGLTVPASLIVLPCSTAIYSLQNIELCNNPTVANLYLTLTVPSGLTYVNNTNSNVTYVSAKSVSGGTQYTFSIPASISSAAINVSFTFSTSCQNTSGTITTNLIGDTYFGKALTLSSGTTTISTNINSFIGGSGYTLTAGPNASNTALQVAYNSNSTTAVQSITVNLPTGVSYSASQPATGASGNPLSLDQASTASTLIFDVNAVSGSINIPWQLAPNTCGTTITGGTVTMNLPVTIACSSPSCSTSTVGSVTPVNYSISNLYPQSPQDVPTITAATSPFCGQATLSVVSPIAGITYQWYMNGSAIGVGTPYTYYNTTSANITGTFTAAAMTLSGCVSPSQSSGTTITIKPAVSVSLTSNNNAPTLIGAPCTAVGTQTSTTPFTPTLTASASPSGATYTYTWYDNGTLMSGQTLSSLSTSSAGTYYVTATSSTGCSNSSNSVTVASSIAISGNNSVCPGVSPNLQVSVPGALNVPVPQWFQAGGTSLSGPPGSASAGTVNYYAEMIVLYTTTQGQAAACTLTTPQYPVTLLPAPNAYAVSAAGPTVVAPGYPVQLIAAPSSGGDPIVNQSWSTGDAVDLTITVTQPGTYAYCVTGQHGCSACNTINVISPLIGATLGSCSNSGYTVTPYSNVANVTQYTLTATGTTPNWPPATISITNTATQSFTSVPPGTYLLTSPSLQGMAVTYALSVPIPYTSNPTNQVAGGNFSSASQTCGSASFSSDLACHAALSGGSPNYYPSGTAPVASPGNYEIVSTTAGWNNPFWNSPPMLGNDGGGSTDYFMLADGAVTSQNNRVWYTVISNISQNSQYVFAASLMNPLDNIGTAPSQEYPGVWLQITDNFGNVTNITAVTDFAPNSGTNGTAPWNQMSGLWTSGQATACTLAIIMGPGGEIGRDLTIDDILFEQVNCSSNGGISWRKAAQPCNATINVGEHQVYVCTSASIQLGTPVASTPSGITYQWSNSSGAISGATNATYTATVANTYTLTVKDGTNNCTVSDNVTVTNFTPYVSITSNKTAACLSGAVNFTNATSNVTVSGNNITKSGTTSAWDAGATSSQLLDGASSVQATLGATTMEAFLGLSYSYSGSSINQMNYGILFNNGTASVYNNGQQVTGSPTTSYTTGQMAEIAVSATGVISYMINGTTFYSQTVTITGPLMANVALYSPSAALNNVGVTSSLVFRTNIFSGMGSPSYQWYVNGSAVATTTVGIYSPVSLPSGAQVYCQLTGVGCTATSNTITTSNGCGGLYFSTGDRVTIPNNAAYNFSGAFTMEAWVKVPSAENYGAPTIIGNETSNTTGFLFTLFGLNQLLVRIDGSNYESSAFASLGDNTCHHVAVTRTSSGTITFYLDGVAHGTATYGSPISSTGPLYIGYNSIDGSSNSYLGSIDEVRLWNFAESPATISANRFLEVPGTSTGLVGYWDFNESGGQVVYDLSSTANNGSLGTNPTAADAQDPARVAEVKCITPSAEETGLTFNGAVAGTRATIPNTPVYNFITDDFTIEAWVNLLTQSAGAPAIVSSRTTMSNGFFFTAYNGTQLLLSMAGTNYICGTALSRNVYNSGCRHLAVTRKNGAVQFYADGTPIGSTIAYSPHSINSPGPLQLGYDSYDNVSVNGNVNELRIWNSALSATSIAANTKTVFPPNTPNLVGYWRLNELATDQIIYDGSSYQNNGYLGTSPAADALDPARTNNACYLGDRVSVPQVLYLTDSSSINNSITNDGIVRIYPNPFSAETNIIVSGSSNVKTNMKIFNVQGITLYDAEINFNQAYKIGAGLEPAMYFVQVMGEDNLPHVYKIVKSE